MAVSFGARQAAAMAVGWTVAAGAAAFSLVYFQEIKAATRIVLGLEAPAPVAAVGGRRGEAALSSAAGRVVEIKAGGHGHYYASVEINGRPVNVLIDSGASFVALTWDDARRAGLFLRDADFTQPVNTANGVARVAPVVLDRISIGDITVRNVQAAVSEPGRLGTSLLGMSFLGRLQRVDMRGGILVLQE